jgi:hypothetical protein
MQRPEPQALNRASRAAAAAWLARVHDGRSEVIREAAAHAHR